MHWKQLVACATVSALVAAAPSTELSIRQNENTNSTSCPGYKASNVQTSGSSITADLTLNGNACNLYGKDVTDLKLTVEYQSENRLHVKIYDKDEDVYQVPEDIFPRPTGTADPSSSKLEFSYTENPFSFSVKRRGSNGDALFDTTGANIVFEPQYVRLRTKLPSNPNIYGLGEHSDSFRLPSNRYSRTLWNRENPNIPPPENLYGSHPVYFEHRGSAGTHGVFLLNSNGMDVNISSDANGQYLQYNTIGGVLDLYIVAGPSPTEVSKQYAEIVGLPAFVPYWSFGYHQCKYGWRDLYESAEVVANYSTAGVPLEVLWNDINYMDRRRDFSSDPQRYPRPLFREFNSVLHSRQQKHVLVTNPGVPFVSNTSDYPPFMRGLDQDVFLKYANGSTFANVVWPGKVAFPDWTHESTQGYWTDEIQRFFNPDDGIDIDGIWIDMNEASLLCPYPCADPVAYAGNSFPPPAPPVRSSADGRTIPGFPADFQPKTPGSGGDTGFVEDKDRQSLVRIVEWQAEGILPPKQDSYRMRKRAGAKGLGDRNYIHPPYAINDRPHAPPGTITNYSINLDIDHANGIKEYDMHNLYGRYMSRITRESMLSRRSGKRTFILSRSTFASSGKDVAHWLGDNNSSWPHYRFQMAGMLQFTSLYQVPMVGSDVCGFNANTTDILCARWVQLASFAPFMRNHADVSSLPQELYRWPLVIEAAKVALNARYRLLDYIYTAFKRQSTDGTPLVTPLWFKYPTDGNTFGIDHQYLYGDSILVSPVLEENGTSVAYYLPNDIWYDYWTYKPVRGNGATVTQNNVNYTTIPLHFRGGSVVPMRVVGANTTTELRKKDFTLVVAPGLDGKASGSLYLDDGESLQPSSVIDTQFSYDGSSLSWTGTFGFDTGGVKVASVVLLGQNSTVSVQNGNKGTYNESSNSVGIEGPWAIGQATTLQFERT